MHIIVKKKYLTFNDYKVKCAVGKRGINIKKKEGDQITPKGNYIIEKIFYRKDRVGVIKTSISKSIIKKNMGWCDDPRSNKYNKQIKLPFKYSSEKLYRKDNMYDIFLVLNFNRHPIKKGKGSAIFIHIAKNKMLPTKGCVAIKKKDLKNLIRLIKKRTTVKII